MANKVQVSKVADIVQNAPLAEILDTVEIVAEFIPAVGGPIKGIIKVLRILVKVQPAAAKTVHGIADMTAKADSGRYRSFIPAGDNPELEKLRIMVDIAIEDGDLSDDEYSTLLGKVDALGIDRDIFTLGIKNELKKQH